MNSSPRPPDLCHIRVTVNLTYHCTVIFSSTTSRFLIHRQIFLFHLHFFGSNHGGCCQKNGFFRQVSSRCLIGGHSAFLSPSYEPVSKSSSTPLEVAALRLFLLFPIYHLSRASYATILGPVAKFLLSRHGLSLIGRNCDCMSSTLLRVCTN
jgi:hypothetical protein